MNGWYDIWYGGSAIIVPGGLLIRSYVNTGYRYGAAMDQTFISCSYEEAVKWVEENCKVKQRARFDNE